jgi:cellulose synthase/poly-beta-1,6-N-acetylglucosamine synthase-like glycosyltransferase
VPAKIAQTYIDSPAAIRQHRHAVAAERGMSSNELAAGSGLAAPSLSADRYDVVILVPCYNEESAIAKVVADFRTALPAATVYVYDNNSTDHTVEAAQQAGGVVRRESHQGKGHVVRRMFNDIEADIYVLVDGDATESIATRRPIAPAIAPAIGC